MIDECFRDLEQAARSHLETLRQEGLEPDPDHDVMTMLGLLVEVRAALDALLKNPPGLNRTFFFPDTVRDVETFLEESKGTRRLFSALCDTLRRRRMPCLRFGFIENAWDILECLNVCIKRLLKDFPSEDELNVLKESLGAFNEYLDRSRNKDYVREMMGLRMPCWN